MRFITFDQATKNTGWSFWEDGKLVRYGLLEVKNEADVIKRIMKMYQQIRDLMKKESPDYVFIEGTQFRNNQKTYGMLAQLQGAIFAACADLDISCLVVYPSSWKSCVGIKSTKSADQKKEIVEIIKEKFGISVTDDVADAIGIGVWGVKSF